MASRRTLISANWKMNHTHLDTIQWLQKFHYALPKDVANSLDVSVHPSFTSLRSAQTVLDADKLPYFLGAQNCHTDASGAFTGEVSAPMLAKLNVRYVIIGHSERRAAGETDELINAKLKAVFAAGMTPILCVGESLAEREEGIETEKVKNQLNADLKAISPDQVATMVIAYEPIWAIGTGRTCATDDAQTMCAAIRYLITQSMGAEVGEAVRIQYGGSAKTTNAAELVAQRDIDGLLVGGASLDGEEFARLTSESAAS